MSIKQSEKEIALSISSKLEFLIKKNNVKNKVISEFVGTTTVNFSKNRNLLKRGKFPASNFLIGISLFFDENFLF